MRRIFWGVVATGAMVATGDAFAAPDAPVSPSGIPYTVPAAARAAGWTIAAPESRLALFAANPVFLSGGARAELALDAAWQHRDLDAALALDRFESRLASVTAKLRTGAVSFGASWQKPYHAQFEPAGRGGEAELQVAVGGAAVRFAPGLSAGASVAAHLLRGRVEGTVYQASAGVQVELVGLSLAGAVKSPEFGGDASDITAPAWVQIDSRLGLGPVVALAARLGVGWWGEPAPDLAAPVDAGVGASWQLLPMLRLLAGAHHIRERGTDCAPGAAVACLDPAFLDLDQGTFLDAGLLLALPVLHVALAVEDNRAFDATSPATWVTLSAGAQF
jgi:hypothetical protein